MANEQQGTLEINAPSLPKGGGAIQSIGKGWGGVGTTGAASLELPLPISKAPNRGMVPAMGLGYSSDVGNSPFGIGWRLTTNAITLRTTKGVPKYDGSDQVVSPGGDVWMPEKSDDGKLISRTVSEYNGVQIGMHHVVRYWPRVEGAFDLIEHWTQEGDAHNPAGFWLIHGADGSLHCYGKTDASRRANPDDKSHVGVWLIDESLNLRGEHVVYEYKAETDEPVAPQFRDYRAQRYLHKVLYGNAQASADLYSWGANGWKEVQWHFHLLFDYGERSTDLTQAPPYQPTGDWQVRSDPFWNYAYGFELGNRRLCRQVLMFHQFTEELGNEPVLVQRLLLEHRHSPLGYNHLTAAHIQVYDNQGQTESRPPMEFFYNPFELDPQRKGYSEFPQMPGINDGQRYQLVDLYGEGMPGVLFSSDKAWYYREPLRADTGGNDVSYGDWKLLPGIPVADSSKPIRQSLSDLTGDGKLDWVIARPGLSGFFTLNPDRTWSNFVAYAAFPTEFFHPMAQLADLVGGGLSDLTLIGPRSVRLYANRREDGFANGTNVPHDDDSLPIPRNVQTELVAFSDPLGSGTQHLIRIRHNEVKCWPNLGHGKFGKGFVLCALPFDYSEFDASRVRLADLDGSGAVDLIYLESDCFQVFMNHSGEGFDQTSVDMPWPEGVRYDRLCQVSIADLQGLGCSSLVLTVPHMQPRHWRYDFVSAKPYLVNATHNNMGTVTGVSYRSSAQEWLDEKAELIAAGKAPVSHLPFAMHLVSQQTQLDEITGNRLTQLFSYRKGYYDSVEREFRGFGELRQRDTEASIAERSSTGFTAPILSVTTFHTGKAVDMGYDDYVSHDPLAVRLGNTVLHEYHLNDAAGRAIVPDEQLAREMARALSGSVLRSEVYAADDDPATAIPYTVAQNRFLIRELKPKGEHQPYAVLQVLPLESIAYQYEPQLADDPLVQHTINLEWDKFGSLIHGFVVHYARRKTDKDSPPFTVGEPEDDNDYENRWWLDAHDSAQQCWYLNQAKAEFRHLEKLDGWRLGLPYRQRGNALVLEKDELKTVDINYEKFLEWAQDDGPWAIKAVMTGLSLQRYQNPADGQLLDPDKLIFEALPDYQETAELDATALSAYDKLKDENGNMPFNLKEKLLSTEVGYHIMDWFLPDSKAGEPADPSDAKNYLWSVRKSFPTYHRLAGFFNVEKLQQTKSHGITTVTYDKHWCLSTAVTLPDGCTTTILGTDYRSFLPAAIEDPNRNIQEACYNAFGEVLVTSFYGTELGEKVGFHSLRSYLPPEDRSPASAIADKNKAIGNYATATFSAPFSWMGRVPPTAPALWLTWACNEGFILPDGHLCSRARVHLEGLQNPSANEQQLQRYVDESHREPLHVVTLQADRYPGDPELQIRAAIACWDGFGRSLQAKQEVEPGMAWVVNDKGELDLDENGRPKEAQAARRWRVSERVEYNNKGETVRIYRPYFASAYRYINDAAIRESGYHDQQFYDAAGRPTHTVLAKKMLQGNPPVEKPLRREQRYRTWYTIAFDENDLFDPPPRNTSIQLDNPMNANLHRHTPALAATDGRGMTVRQVAYFRAVESDHPTARISTQQNDAAGRLVAQRDPRLSSAANQTALYSLSGAALLTDSVDAGWRLGLTGEAGQVLEQWDGRGSHWLNDYDQLRRPIAIHEIASGMEQRTVERLTYADNSPEFAERNQCGSVIRQDDPAGTVWFRQVALNGGLIRQTRRFLPDQAGLLTNWPANEVDRDLLLQPGEGYTSESRYGPSGEVLEQIDAGGHLQQLNFDRAGQLQRIDLMLKGLASKPLLKAADYNAAGQLLTQITGNNVTSVASYQPENGRLVRLTATTSTRQRLQEMSYEYDPVGNILRLIDHTQADSFFDNQRVAAENTYTYDSLYQLTSAKGRETAGAGQTPGLPELSIPSPIDPARLLNYTEYYEYDTGGNRTLLRHESDKNPFSRRMYVDPLSNRALPWNEGQDAPEFSRHFDANGNLQYLVPGAQTMTWNARNQLQSIITVLRPGGVNDGEWYRYNAVGERVVKFSTRQAGTVSHQDVVHYLPGLEVRTADEREELQVIHVQLARGSVRCLHWIKGTPDGIDNDQLRYSIDDHLGSSSLELDELAGVISHEGYYPYGGTAWWAARSKVDADYKTIRYSGKERDTCGLYYYGARYYAGWLGRWINPDPAGNIDGLNLYRMTGNNPINYKDLLGNVRTAINKDIHLIWVGEDASKLKPLTDNINNTATQADGYKVHLYLDSAKEDKFANVVEELKIHDFIPLRGSELFNDFQNSQTATIYNDFRSGSPLNFAHAVDVLRVFIVDRKGGIYSDVDDHYFHEDMGARMRLGDRSIGAEPDELRTLPPVLVPWEAASKSRNAYINNSSFAAHSGNKVLKDLSKEMVVRYNKTFDLKQYNDDNDFIGAGILSQEPVDRFKIMSSMVGPGVLTDVYKRNDDEVEPAISNSVAHFYGEKIDQNTLEKTERKWGLGWFMTSGGLASWRKPL